MSTINSIGSQKPIETAYGGTGNSSLTSHGIMVGAGTGAVVPLAEATDGQIPLGSTGNAPVLGTLTAGMGISITNAAGSVTVTNTVSGAAVNNQTGTAYTALLTDQNDMITLNNAAGITMTIPPASSVNFPIGTQIAFQQLGAGQVTLTAGSGVTFRSADDAYKLVKQYSGAFIMKIASDTWSIFGDVEA